MFFLGWQLDNKWYCSVIYWCLGGIWLWGSLRSVLVFWNAEWISENITLKELYPIIVAIEVWGYRIANKSICFNCDNEALVYVLNKQSSTEKRVMFLIRRLVLLTLHHNILFTANHLPGKLNILSDALSRLQIAKFKMLMPDADNYQTSIPPLPTLPT